MSLEIKNLTISVEDKQITNDLSIEIKKGETHVVMGPNGAGKSTLVKAIGGHPSYSVSSGDIVLDNTSIIHDSPDKRAKKGLFVSLQQQTEIPGVSIANFLRIASQSLTGEKLNPIAFHKVLVEHCKALSFDPSVLGRSLNVGFSGGEKKRLELLQLQVLNPETIVLDETDSGLDVDALKIVGEGISKIQDGTKSILLVTHYNRLPALMEVTKVHVMIDGKIVQSGGPELTKDIEEQGYKDIC